MKPNSAILSACIILSTSLFANGAYWGRNNNLLPSTFVLNSTTVNSINWSFINSTLRPEFSGVFYLDGTNCVGTLFKTWTGIPSAAVNATKATALVAGSCFAGNGLGGTTHFSNLFIGNSGIGVYFNTFINTSPSQYIPVSVDIIEFATIQGYDATVMKLSATVSQLLNAGFQFYDSAPSGLSILNVQGVTITGGDPTNALSFRVSTGENLGLGMTSVSNNFNGNAIVSTNYDAFRTRFVNTDLWSPIFTIETTPRLLGFSTSGRLAENTATRIDIVQSCFTDNTFNISLPLCLPGWKYVINRNYRITVPDAVSFAIAMSSYTPSASIKVDAPSPQWPIRNSTYDYYVDTLGLGSD